MFRYQVDSFMRSHRSPGVACFDNDFKEIISVILESTDITVSRDCNGNLEGDIQDFKVWSVLEQKDRFSMILQGVQVEFNEWHTNSMALDEAHEMEINLKTKKAINTFSLPSLTTMTYYLPYRAETLHNMKVKLDIESGQSGGLLGHISIFLLQKSMLCLITQTGMVVVRRRWRGHEEIVVFRRLTAVLSSVVHEGLLLPSSWRSFLANRENKRNLVNFLSYEFLRLALSFFKDGLCTVITAGGFDDDNRDKALGISSLHVGIVEFAQLSANHENVIHGGCDFVLFFHGCGKKAFLDGFYHNAQFIASDLNLSTLDETGLCSFYRLVASVYFAKHRPAFRPSASISEFYNNIELGDGLESHTALVKVILWDSDVNIDKWKKLLSGTPRVALAKVIVPLIDAVAKNLVLVLVVIVAQVVSFRTVRTLLVVKNELSELFDELLCFSDVELDACSDIDSVSNSDEGEDEVQIVPSHQSEEFQEYWDTFEILTGELVPDL
ncbi:unnamed protein product [Mytilus coruscus]|uniref:Uncharacterized protein n=1 Tax=Mytilus coruscus TaxID=42192 RepID=A0A6J8DML3_MYTCO|nr:unnamed protein product [Mytilus coruscus]